MFQVSLEQGQSILVVAAVAVLAFAATIWFYRRLAPEVTRGRWYLLLALRFLAIVLLLLLIFRPVLTLPTESPDKRGVIFLVDTSASMATTDDEKNTTRLDQVRRRLADWWQKLDRDYHLEIVQFSDQAVAVNGLAGLAELKPTGPATSLTRGIQAAAQRLPRKDVEAIILLSDGVHNAAGDPAQTARKLGMVVHTVGVGASRRNLPSYRDVMVSALECPPRLVLNNRARIAASVESVGLAGRVVKALLEEDGKMVDQLDLTLNSGRDPQPAAFEFLPTAKGQHTYTVRIPVLSDELIPQNNQRSVQAQVVDARIRVLYLEGALRAEYGALVERFFSKDPDLEFCALVQSQRNVFVQRSNIPDLKLDAIPSDPAVLEKFNVFVLGDLDSSFLKPAQMAMLAKRARDGAGLVMLGGYNSLGPGGYGGTPLEEILPVFVGDRKIGQITDPFVPALTAEGRGHPIFANIGKFFPAHGEPLTSVRGSDLRVLPPLAGCVKVMGRKPAAVVLAVHPSQPPLTLEGRGAGAEGGMPILAIQAVGKGRSAVFTGDTTRNWQQVPRALDQESPFTRFWGQLIRWLANRTDSLPSKFSITAQTDKVYYDPDAPITITALVRDKEGEGTSQATVRAKIRLRSQESGGRSRQSGSPSLDTCLLTTGPSAGQYQGQYEPKSSGTYEIVVEATLTPGPSPGGEKGGGVTVVEAEKITIEVGRTNLEYDRLDLDDRMLEKIAAATGGNYYHLSNGDRLIDQLNHKEQRRQVVLEQPLYSPPLFWLLFVGALVNEWFLRKRYQLR